MSTREDLELLDQMQIEAELMADEVEATTEGAFDRREFVFLSLVTAAASTFGFGSRALAQAPAGAPQAAPQTPLPPLGNGEPVSWTFQPYPGGTGALMEKLIHERGAAAFQRSAFTERPGLVPSPPRRMRSRFFRRTDFPHSSRRGRSRRRNSRGSISIESSVSIRRCSAP